MKFLIDMPLSPSLARWLVGQGHEADHAAEIGLSRAPDSEILAIALREHQTIITADLDYPRLLALSAAAGPSLILFRGGNWSDSEIIAQLGAILDEISDIENSIIVVEPMRIRRRRLPV